jgi:hypothetical protein
MATSIITAVGSHWIGVRYDNCMSVATTEVSALPIDVNQNFGTGCSGVPSDLHLHYTGPIIY